MTDDLTTTEESRHLPSQDGLRAPAWCAWEQDVCKRKGSSFASRSWDWSKKSKVADQSGRQTCTWQDPLRSAWNQEVHWSGLNSHSCLPPSNPAVRERAIHVPAAFLIGSSSSRYRAVCHNHSACSCFVFRRSLPPTYIMMLNFVLRLQSGCSEEA